MRPPPRTPPPHPRVPKGTNPTGTLTKGPKDTGRTRTACISRPGVPGGGDTELGALPPRASENASLSSRPREPLSDWRKVPGLRRYWPPSRPASGSSGAWQSGEAKWCAAGAGCWRHSARSAAASWLRPSSPATRRTAAAGGAAACLRIPAAWGSWPWPVRRAGSSGCTRSARCAGPWVALTPARGPASPACGGRGPLRALRSPRSGRAVPWSCCWPRAQARLGTDACAGVPARVGPSSCRPPHSATSAVA